MHVLIQSIIEPEVPRNERLIIKTKCDWEWINWQSCIPIILKPFHGIS